MKAYLSGCPEDISGKALIEGPAQHDKQFESVVVTVDIFNILDRKNFTRSKIIIHEMLTNLLCGYNKHRMISKMFCK